MDTVIGKGSLERRLTESEVESICEDALSRLALDGKRILVLLPDHTRHGPIDLFFRVISRALEKRVKQLDYLIATGTHASMEQDRIYRHVGITAAEHATRYAGIRFFNHAHRDKRQLVTLGILEADEAAELTNGLFRHKIPITINRLAIEYDHLLIVSPVVPHECLGFAGGNKYFFPGIAGLDVVETFHWLAAIITNPAINGVKDTPTRRVIDRAVRFLRTPRTCFAFTIDDRHQMACLFAGSPEAAWSSAADYSAQLHIKYLDRPYKRVLGLTPPIYEELWVAGKAMYKLEPIVADGGELVIHGPHVKEISFMHGDAIARLGYHTRDYFTSQWDRFAQEPRLIMAHSTNVKGVGRFEQGVEIPRIQVSLATSIPRATCERVNLGYRDVESIDVEAWRRDPDTLVVEEAGQVLFRLRSKCTS